MNSIKNLLFLVLYSFTTAASAQYIIVDDTKTAQELVENVLVKSDCARVSSPYATGDNFTTGQKSYGYFNAGTSNFPIREGVILSTSTSKEAIGPYTNGGGTGNSSWLGDSDLDQTLGITSINATVLEFDFIPLTTSISFNYIFASNEYQLHFPCEFSDAFAFLIKEKGSADNYKNIAVLPGTTTPVSSKNVHPTINDVVDPLGTPHSGCPAVNESYFGGYNDATSPINYSSQIVKMNAHTDVIIGKTYHIKLVIADDKYKYYDSAIFLEAGSFSADIDLGPDRTSATNNPLCYGESFTIDTKLPVSYAYEWYKDGSTTPIQNELNPTITITDPGTYKVKVILSPTACTAEAEIKIEYTPQIILSNTTLYQCDDNSDGISVFDLTKVDNIIKNNDPKLTKLVYYKSLTDAQNETNPIQNPSAYTNSVPNETLTARVSNDFGCANYAQLTLIIPNNNIPPQSPIQKVCLDRLAGPNYENLNSQVTPQILNGLPPGLIVEYYGNMNDAISQKNLLQNNYGYFEDNLNPTLFARIVNGTDCYGIIKVPFNIVSFDPPNFQDETIGLCDGANKDLTIDSGFSSYLWSNGDTTNTTNVTAPGEYSVIVTNSEGCQKTKKFIVKSSGIATITSVTVSDFSGTENSVTISYSGNGDYEFSLDGNYYQDSPVFNRLTAGIYWATARDKNGCGTSVPYKVYILDYPRFFTPNNDGYNDTWIIKNLDALPKSTIAIFNRYGKLLKQLNATNSGWNGTYTGKSLPSDDYWFTLTFEDGKIIKGHFSLKR
ncbi:choice-of-anchor L domain-containing protein [Flavobacterium granuli]|uniref:Gliding motility-associated-like protein n=1 Tax=Flavobacterium granuli TaxID=280093 RepID=A0ABU1S515_9FLAO|nr:choice-of-anchor L domain-containing protein [Flavobacterium granuli]MDR6846121.1 gliding motility-associated-like protein [Flavobacterium granuli]